MDQLPEIQAALALSPIWDGQGGVYEIAGDLVLPDGAMIENATFVQLAPSVTRRSLVKQGGWVRGLRNVKVDRGLDKQAGSLSNSAGIHLESCGITAVMDGIEVFGHGKGTGLYLLRVHNPVPILNLNVHDMRFSAASDPGSEQIFGLWLNSCSHVKVIDALIEKLGSDIPGANWFIQTDGITVSGGHAIELIRPVISFCCEGIDFTGSFGNRNFSIVGAKVRDCDSFGIKLANSARHGLVMECQVDDCARACFVISGPSEANLPRIEDIDFVQCTARNPGSSRNYPTWPTAAFQVMRGAFDYTYPQQIRFHNCVAQDTQVNKSMKYGFYNDNNNTSNILRYCSSIGHTI